MKWLLILTIYFAPPDAVDWDGPWKIGVSNVSDETFDDEASCRTEAVQVIGRVHQGMLAPVRYRCVPVEATLPAGAPR